MKKLCHSILVGIVIAAMLVDSAAARRWWRRCCKASAKNCRRACPCETVCQAEPCAVSLCPELPESTDCCDEVVAQPAMDCADCLPELPVESSVDSTPNPPSNPAPLPEPVTPSPAAEKAVESAPPQQTPDEELFEDSTPLPVAPLAVPESTPVTVQPEPAGADAQPFAAEADLPTPQPTPMVAEPEPALPETPDTSIVGDRYSSQPPVFQKPAAVEEAVQEADSVEALFGESSETPEVADEDEGTTETTFEEPSTPATQSPLTEEAFTPPSQESLPEQAITPANEEKFAEETMAEEPIAPAPIATAPEESVATPSDFEDSEESLIPPADDSAPEAEEDLDGLFGPSDAAPADAAKPSPTETTEEAPILPPTSAPEIEPAPEPEPEPEKKKVEEYSDPFDPFTRATEQLNEQVSVLKSAGGLRSDDSRTWTDNTASFRCRARLVRVTGKQVILHTSNGKQFVVPFTRLADDDLHFVKEQISALRIVRSQGTTTEKFAMAWGN